MEKLIELRGICKSFFGAKALDHMDFSVGYGEAHCLVGENGCGKSTLIKVISGFYQPDEGEIWIDGKQYTKLSPIDSIQAGVQVIYQDFSLFPNMTVGENITMLSRIYHKERILHWKNIQKESQKALDMIGVQIDSDILVENLNVAQKQLVAIARAVMLDAKLIIMDEPTSALTQKEINRLMEIVDGLKKKGVAILFVSHKMNEVLQIADQVTVMRNGHHVYTGDVGCLNQDKLVYYMTGKKFVLEPPDNSCLDRKKPILSVHNLNSADTLKDINFTLYTGEAIGFTGPLDSGRDELAKTLFGMLSIHSGQVQIDGRTVQLNSIDDALKNGIGYVPEDRLTEGLHLDHSIGDNAVARIIREHVGKFGLLNTDELKRQRDVELSRFTIAGMKVDKPAQALSGGNQQKVVLVKWLAAHPRILILNCPTVGVDIGAKSDIHTLIRKLVREDKIGVIVISDDTNELLSVCNRILVMRQGRIVDEIQSTQVTTEELEYMQVKDYSDAIGTNSASV